MNRMFPAFAAVLLIPASAVHALQAPPVNRDAQVLVDFKTRVEKYVELRKKLDHGTPTLKKMVRCFPVITTRESHHGGR